MRTRLLLITGALLLNSFSVPGAEAATSPCGVFDAQNRVPDPVLGAGLTLSTPAAANYFAAGQAPQVTLTNISAVPLDRTVTWTVRNRARVLLSKSAPLGTGINSLQLPPAVAGLYQLEAHLTQGGLERGAACLRYGVGMPGALLAPSSLPAGKDWGGGGAERDVVLHSELGIPVVRRQANVASFLANPAVYDQEWTAAAAQAKARGVALVVQIGQGGQAERTAIQNGTWEKIVRDLVSRQKGVVPYWEAWNEPNATYFYPGNVTHFVSKTLVPFARAVRAADPAAKVVGGSAFGMGSVWWTAFGKAGGFRAVDIVAVHAYAWASSYEASGSVAALKNLIAIKNTYGGAGKPLWDTESGYKSTVEMGGPYAQADNVTRKLLWQRTLGIKGNNFLLEGGWEDWSVIDYFRGVKPAALAMSTQRTVLDHRAFLGWVSTGVAGVYAARFGPRDAGGTTVTAVWTAGRLVRVPLRIRHSAYDETGAPSVISTSVVARGDVQYLLAPKGQPAF